MNQVRLGSLALVVERSDSYARHVAAYLPYLLHPPVPAAIRQGNVYPRCAFVSGCPFAGYPLASGCLRILEIVSTHRTNLAMAYRLQDVAQLAFSAK